MEVRGKYFCGNEVSEYGQEHNRVDYATLAKSFDCVMNNDIISNTADIGYWESENDEYFEDTDGNRYTYDEAQERIEELNEELDKIDEDSERAEEIRDDLEAMEDSHYKEIYQYYIVSDAGAEILREAGEILFYNEALDMYVWGVDHWGTSWNYVLTDIRCNVGEDENAA